jgi:hypothetical protein
VSVRVPSGARTVGVRVYGHSMDVRASGTISGTFEKGGVRHLEIQLNAYTSSLDLEWKD